MHLSSTSAHQLAVSGQMLVTGTVTFRQVTLVTGDKVIVSDGASLTLHGVLVCGPTSVLQIFGNLAIDSPQPTHLACSTSGTGTLAISSELSITSAFDVASIL